MTFLIPFIWSPLIFSITNPDPTITELKDMRDKDMHDLHWKEPPPSGD